MAKRTTAVKNPTRADMEPLAEKLKALADPGRLLILRLLAINPRTVTDLLGNVDDLTQPTISHHLSVLRNAGFVEREKDGAWATYSIRPKGIEHVLDQAEAVITSR